MPIQMFWERVGGRAATKIHSNHHTIYPKFKKNLEFKFK
jgi:hypothetical protein